MEHLQTGALRLGIECNFPRACGDERTKEALDTFDTLVNSHNNYEKLQQINKELIEALEKTLDKLIEYAEDDYDAQCNGWGLKGDARGFIGHTRVSAEAILRKAKDVTP